MTEESIDITKSLVTQSNALVGASYNLSLAEKRIILFMLSQIQRTDEDFKPYRINIKDFTQELGTRAKNEYSRAQAVTKQLMSRVLQIKQPDGLLQVSFLSSAKYVTGKGFVELCFDPQLKPFLLHLKECFTSYDIRNVLSLTSFHSIRLYELLKQYEAIGERTFEIDELKEILGLKDKYNDDYTQFKKRVIIQAQKDLEENADLMFSFQELKQGRRVAKIKFYINRKMKLLPEPSIKHPELVKELIDLGIERNQAVRFVQVKDIAFLRESIDYAKKQYSVNKVHSSLGGYLKSVIEKEAASTTNYEKRVQAELEQKAKQLAEERAQIEAFKFEYAEQRKKKLDELLAQMTEQEKKNFFNSRSGFERVMVFDEKNNLKENIASGLLRAHLAKENGLEDTDEAFKLWVKQNKEVELTQQLREGILEWVFWDERLRMV